MAASFILILSDLSEESVGSHVPRVILFCTIPTSILVILVVPAKVPIVPADPLVAPKADSESKPAEQRHERHESLAVHDDMVSRWRDGVASRPSSPLGSSSHNTLTPSFEFPLNPVVALPRIRRRPAILVWPEPSLDSSSKRSLDSSSHSARPSHKRCRSLTILVLSFTHVSRSIAPIHADLLPPCKRFKDSYSPEDSIEEHKEIGIADVEAVADLGIDDGVGAHTEDGIGMGVKIAASDIREDEEKFEAEASIGGTMEIDVDPLVISGISESTEGDSPDLEGGNGDKNGGGNGNRIGRGNRNKNGNENPNRNDKGVMPVIHEFTYQDFMKCQPLNFKGTKGVFRAMYYEMWEVQQGQTFDQGLSDYPKLKDQNCGNKTRNRSGIGEARGKAYVLCGGDANLNSNVLTDTFLLNNCYASMLFDSGAVRSFVSTTFSALLDVFPSTLDVSYVVELADGRIF
nr:reverse transcriptase domain-containing protein [Tanacetum cinerariifolium]